MIKLIQQFETNRVLSARIPDRKDILRRLFAAGTAAGWSIGGMMIT